MSRYKNHLSSRSFESVGNENYSLEIFYFKKFIYRITWCKKGGKEEIKIITLDNLEFYLSDMIWVMKCLSLPHLYFWTFKPLSWRHYEVAKKEAFNDTNRRKLCFYLQTWDEKRATRQKNLIHFRTLIQNQSVNVIKQVFSFLNSGIL